MMDRCLRAFVLTASLVTGGTAAYAQAAGANTPAVDGTPSPAPSAPPPAANEPSNVPAPSTDAGSPSTTEASGPLASPADDAEKNVKILSAIASLAPMIGDVQIVGPWVDENRQGVWRTVMTQSVGETAGNRFFVQQIEEKDGESTVASSIEVTEIADLNGAIVGYRADAPTEGQESNLTLFFDFVPLDGEVSETYELFIAPNQAYRFGPASN